MSPRQLALLFAITLLVMLVVLLPLRLGLGVTDLAGHQLAARDVTGTLWHGRLRAATWRGRTLGDLSIGLQPLSALIGIRRVDLAANRWSATVAQGRVRGVEHGEGEINLGPIASMPGLDITLLPHDASITFSKGRCHRASGTVEIEFQLGGTGNAMPSIVLGGRAICEGNVAVVALTPVEPVPAGASRTEVTLRIDADGRYQAESLVRAMDPATTELLLIAGFQQSPSGLSRVDTGSLFD